VSEYYYLVKTGECVLSHKDEKAESSLISNKLKMWDSFGAEALIYHKTSSQTVTALTPLSLLRINKENFLTLIKKPILKFVDEEKTNALLDDGAILLDVRPAADYEKNHSLQAINAPLLELREFIKKLDKSQPIIIISDDIQLSEAAAFLLLSYKFVVYVCEKNTESTTSELIINVRKPITHSTPADDTIVIEMMDDNLVFNENIVIETRSLPTHSTPLDENANLRQQLQELQLKVEKLEQEKLEMSEKYQLLLKQAEKLKGMVASLTKYNGMI
jgi:rhodanese-related sulfurtransferase